MATFSNRRGCDLHPNGSYICKWRTIFQDCTTKWISRAGIALIFAIMLIVLLFIFQPFQSEVHVVLVNAKDSPIHVTHPYFLSVSLDSSLIAEGFQGFNLSDKRLSTVMAPLGNSYLRIGGTMADRLIFDLSERPHRQFKSSIYKLLDGDDCAYEGKSCNPLNRPNFTMSGEEWSQLNHLAQKTGFTILFDLNCLQRYPNGTWNSENAEELIKYSDERGFNIIWELGNEPNSFLHVFNYEVKPAQLAADFKKLRQILDKYDMYKNSMLVGPDVTRPRAHSGGAMHYLSEFLSSTDGKIVDAITWHQYYFNGRDAYLYYFISPDIFNALQNEINKVKEVVKASKYENTPIWLGETSSAYGGGAMGFSDRFISTFIWMDKLGLAAKNGIDLVIRQSLYKGYYALIGDSYVPNPDWWLSVLYKKLVGNTVIECWSAAPSEVRLYCHCNGNNTYVNGPAITVYGLNMKNSEAEIKLQEVDVEWFYKYKALAFILQTRISVLSRYIFLNDEVLALEGGKLPNFEPVNVTTNYLTMPPFSLAFWIIPSNSFAACHVP